MLQGAEKEAQKCHVRCAPNFLQRVMLRTQQCHTSITSKGAISASRQRHFSRAPTSFIWCQQENAVMPVSNRTKGRVTPWPQRCYSIYALPIQFNGVMVKTQKCQDIVAPRERSTNPRRNAEKRPPLPTSLQGATPWAQIAMYFSPPPITGDTDMTQQCLDHNSPRERSYRSRRNATIGSPLPTSLTGS